MAVPHANMSAQSGTNNQVKTPSLLSLPPELRLNIYEYVLYDHYSTADPQIYVEKSLRHPMVNTCQLIRTESLRIYSKALDMYWSRLWQFCDAIKTKMDDTLKIIHALLDNPRPRYDILHPLYSKLEGQGKQKGAMEKIRQPQFTRVYWEKRWCKEWRPTYPRLPVRGEAVVKSSRKRKR